MEAQPHCVGGSASGFASMSLPLAGALGRLSVSGLSLSICERDTLIAILHRAGRRRKWKEPFKVLCIGTGAQ